MTCRALAAGVTHDFAENWGPSTISICARSRLVAPLRIRRSFAGLDQLDQPVALAQRRPFFVAEVVSCFHGRFGQRAIGEPCEFFDQFVIFEGIQRPCRSTTSPIVYIP